MALKNAYGTITGKMTVTGATLVDLVSANNGTLAGASLPTYNANGYLSFVGGNGVTGGDRCRVDIGTRSDFDYEYNSSFSIICVFRSTKNDANFHYLVTNIDASVPNNLFSIRIDTDESDYFNVGTGTGALKVSTGIVNVCDGKWHVAIITYSENSAAFYIDGVLSALTTNNNITSGSMYSANSKATIGARWSQTTANYANDFTGDVSCVYGVSGSKLPVGNVADINNQLYLLM